jgi:hypothetical protein
MDFEKEEARIRGVFGLPRGEEIPEVGLETLKAYQRYLETRLSFPFMAEFERETGPEESIRIRIRVHGLEDLEKLEDDLYGLFCHGRVGRKKWWVPLAEIDVTDKEGPNRQLVEDYSSWFANYR